MLRFKEKKQDKKKKKSGFHCGMDEVSAELSSTEDKPRENNCRKVFVISPKYDNLHSRDSPRSLILVSFTKTFMTLFRLK